MVFVGLPYVKEVPRIDIDISYSDVVASGQRHIGPVARLEELCPGAYHKERAARSRYVFYAYLLVMLRRIGAHLQPQHPIDIVYIYV